MGKIVLIFIFTFCTMVSAQIRGTSQVGSLKLKKDAKGNLPAKITLIEPLVQNGEELTVESSDLVIRGKIENNETVKAVRVNNQEVTLDENNSFYYESKLQPGLNRFLIRPVSESSSSSSFEFYIRSQPKNSGSAITLLQPVPDKNNEVRLKEKSLLVKVMIKDIKDLKEVLINNKKANSIKKTEFYTNLSLNDGYNSVSIKAVDKKGRITETDFKVIVDSDREGPKIKIIEPVVSRGIRIVRKTETLSVKGKAEDKSGVYEVTINGIRTDLQPDGSFSLNMFLAMGDNLLVVKALDNNLNAAIDTFRVTRKLEDLLVAGKFYGFIVGIDSYKGYWPPLKNAINDAKEVAAVLKDKYGFDSVITILDRDATRRNILTKFEWFADHLEKEDNLLIFYAGHGQFNKNLNRGYWVPSDAESNSIADYIPNGEVRTFLAGIPAKHILLITDACFGGDIFRGKKTESYAFDPNNMEKYYREVYKRQSRLALTSGGVEEVMDDGKDGHSIFTYYLLKALNENKNRYMDAAQLYNELRIAVANNSDQTPILQAVKDTYDEGGQFIFVNRSEK